MSRGAKTLSAIAGILAAISSIMSLAGCAESRDVKLNPVWSATLPGEDVTWSKTVNYFPFYSKNTAAFSDRYEESGNFLLFVSWSRTTPRTASAPVGPVQVTPGVSAASPAHVIVPGLAAPKLESSGAL